MPKKKKEPKKAEKKVEVGDLEEKKDSKGGWAGSDHYMIGNLGSQKVRADFEVKLSGE